SGLRFTITRHNTKADIDLLTDVMAHHLPLAIEEENDQIERVYQCFNVPYLGIPKDKEQTNKASLIVEEFSTIHDVDQKLWDNALGDRGTISHDCLICMEEIFSNNERPEENWSFHYLIVKDKEGKLVLATFFTGALYKDDLSSLENISIQIEEMRKTNPYFLCSKTLAMGALFSEGNYIYLDTNHREYKKSIELLFVFVAKMKLLVNATVVLFRDFEEDHLLNSILENEGYAKIRMPNSMKIENPYWNNYEELLSHIPSAKKRRNIRKEALKFEHLFDVEIKNKLTQNEAIKYYELFQNIKENNFAFNFFSFPQKIASVLSKHDDWEFIDLKLKGENETIGCVWSYIGNEHYSPLIMGLNYKYAKSHYLYKQVIFQIVKRANELNKLKVYMGFSADFEKQKYMAITVPTFAFLKVDDTYNFEYIETMSNVSKL
ncbi:MAG: hypothetical protein ACJASR_001755, partial [Psychroserpens sp.]